MKKTIFEQEMEDPKFKAIYDEISAQIDIDEQRAELKYKLKTNNATKQGSKKANVH